VIEECKFSKCKEKKWIRNRECIQTWWKCQAKHCVFRG